MSILFSTVAHETLLEDGFQADISLEQLVTRLDRLKATGLNNDPSVRKVPGSSEDIYVMRLSGIRIFLMQSGDDIVILSMEYV